MFDGIFERTYSWLHRTLLPILTEKQVSAATIHAIEHGLEVCVYALLYTFKDCRCSVHGIRVRRLLSLPVTVTVIHLPSSLSTAKSGACVPGCLTGGAL